MAAKLLVLPDPNVDPWPVLWESFERSLRADGAPPLTLRMYRAAGSQAHAYLTAGGQPTDPVAIQKRHGQSALAADGRVAVNGRDSGREGRAEAVEGAGEDRPSRPRQAEGGVGDCPIDSGPVRGKTQRWKRSDVGSGDVDATGSEFSSNERIHTLEPNSNAAFADVDPNSGR
jgi:hypothetical protein